MQLTYHQTKEIKRVVNLFIDFVNCPTTKYVKDFLGRYGIPTSFFYKAMEWGESNIQNFSYRKLKNELLLRRRL